MTHVFVYNCETSSRLECEQDDPSVREMDLSHFASPSLTGVASMFVKAERMAKAELISQFEEEMDDGDCVPETIIWSRYRIESVLDSRRDSWRLTATFEGEIVGMAIIQELQLDS